MPEIDEVRFWRLRSRIGLGPRKALESCLDTVLEDTGTAYYVYDLSVDSTALLQGPCTFTTRTGSFTVYNLSERAV